MTSTTNISPQDPPRTMLGILRRMGPGIIVAGSIVGSGELIATTSVGAESGFRLLWLILLGCGIKVFVQIELGRDAVTWSQTTLDAVNQIPGPRAEFTWHDADGRPRRIGANWILSAWAVMTLLVLTQQGGIVGGVGQALAMQFPLTEYGRSYNQRQNALIAAQVQRARVTRDPQAVGELESTAATLARLEAERTLEMQKHRNREPPDSRWWATAVALVTSGLMLAGRYGLIQAISTLFVGSFTLLTIFTLCMLQRHPDWAIGRDEFWSGLTFSLPNSTGDRNAMATALATFGLIGVGAGELLMYPYWCVEKGYARFTGLRSDEESWAIRARGWMRVMQWDAWGSLVIYTFATAAFYLLGAAVLWRVGLNPGGGEMVRTLSQMYVPVFGEFARALFLGGAFAVLYSTFFVVTAGFSRLVADGLGVMGLVGRDQKTQARYITRLGVAWPLLAVALFWFFRSPKAMVLASGVAQAAMLPILGIAALYFRYRRGDPRLRPSRLWDLCLWMSCLGFLLVGVWAVVTQFGL